MSLLSSIADVLLKRGLATRAGASRSTLADGNTQDVDVIMINSITVDGRVLHGVEAVVVRRRGGQLACRHHVFRVG